MLTKETLEKYKFIKTEKNKDVYYEDYLAKEINTKFPYFSHLTLHVPKKIRNSIEFNNSKLILHRYYNLESWNKNKEHYDTKTIYEGLLENEEDLKFILNKTQVY